MPKYIDRTIERKLMKASEFFKAVLVTGARQVGKTTMLMHMAGEPGRECVSMDIERERRLALDDPELFFSLHKPPLIIDEIQKAPALFEPIKVICDSTERTGLFWLTGSQSYEAMRGVGETLAGRIGILHMYGLSRAEAEGYHYDAGMSFDLDTLRARSQAAGSEDVQALFKHIFTGGMPAVRDCSVEHRSLYFDSYVDTYLLRDAREDAGISDTKRFETFLSACAALTGQQVNYATLADAAGISQPTAKSWLYALEGLGIVYLLAPYSNNALKRLTKTPKMYFCDTGLCAHLAGWTDYKTLMRGPSAGAYLETYVIGELVKEFAYGVTPAKLSYYRDSSGREIDILVEQGDMIYPLEVKMSVHPDGSIVKHFNVLDNTALKRGNGGIVCPCREPFPIDRENCFIPTNIL